MNTPKYKIIYDQIVKFILTDVWPVGSNMKSENELIKLFGVSRLTIRNVLNILENLGGGMVFHRIKICQEIKEYYL